MGGRVAAFEVLFVNSAISNLIREEKTFQIGSLMQTQKGAGMQTMIDSMVSLVRSGVIAPVEAWNQAVEKKEMGVALTRAGFSGAWSDAST